MKRRAEKRREISSRFAWGCAAEPALAHSSPTHPPTISPPFLMSVCTALKMMRMSESDAAKLATSHLDSSTIQPPTMNTKPMSSASAHLGTAPVRAGTEREGGGGIAVSGTAARIIS